MSHALSRFLVASVILSLSTHANAAGVLVPRDGSAPIRVRSQRVTTVIDDGLARTTVRQTFVNPQRRALEAVYEFPIPDGAALADLALEVGGQRLEGFLADRRTARHAYDTITRAGRDPALVEQIGRSLFRMSVFPVVPDAPTVVELTWIEACPRIRGEVRWVYPLALAGDAATKTVTEHDFTVAVTLRSSGHIESFASPTAGVSAHVDSAHEAHASFERSQSTLTEDVVVVARVAVEEPTLAVHVYRPPRGDAFFAAVVTPPDLADDRVLARDVTLVLDVSGSMGREKLDQAKRAAEWLLDHLRAKDRVNILMFNDVVRRAADQPLPATTETIDRMRGFVRAASSAGGTALGDAVKAACTTPTEPGRVAAVVLLTDGLPTIGETAPVSIIAHAREGAARGLRVFAFGVGEDVDASLLEGIAAASGGAAEVFRPEGEIETRLVAFLSRTESPALTELAFTIGGRAVDDLLPRPLPDVHLGEQAVFTGRCANVGPADVALACTSGERKLVVTARVDFGGAGIASGDPVARDHFARQRLAFLELAHRLRTGLPDEAYFQALDRNASATPDELVAAEVETSLATGVQCPHTSFLTLLPDDRRRLDPHDAAALDAAVAIADARRKELSGGVDSSGGREVVVEESGAGSGPTTPGGGRGPTSGGSSPRGPGRGGSSGGKKNGGGATGEGFEQWQFWWENNKDRYLAPRVRAGACINSGGRARFDEASVHSPAWDETVTHIIPVLKAVLSDDDADIVDSAVLALGRITPVDQSALVLDDVKKVLGNINETPQQSALLSLGVLGSPDAIPLLTEVMNDSAEGRRLTNSNGEIHELQRSFAAISLGLLGRPNTLPSLFAVLHDAKNRIGVRASAILALGLFQDDNAEIVSDLLPLLDDDTLDPTMRAQVPISLGRLGEPAAIALPLLRKLLMARQTPHVVRQSAAIAIGALASPRDQEVIDDLQNYIEDGDDEQTRHFALIALAQIGAKAAKEPNPHADALDRTTTFLTKELLGQTRSKKITHRPWAGLALALIGHELNPMDERRLEITSTLSHAFDDEKNPSYRSAYAIGLGLLDAKSAGATLLKTMTDANDASLKGYCAVSLGMLHHLDAKESLRQLVLDDRDPRMRLQVATALGLLGDADAVPLLVNALRSAKTLGVISSIAKALGKIGDRNAIEPLARLIRDQGAPGLARGFACIALGLIAEKSELPWNASLSANANYRTVVGAQYEILDIL